VLAADAGYGDATPSWLGRIGRSIPWVMAVKFTTRAHPAEAVPTLMNYTGRGPRPRTPHYHQDPVAVKGHCPYCQRAGPT
jgi:hypothetical protein